MLARTRSSPTFPARPNPCTSRAHTLKRSTRPARAVGGFGLSTIVFSYCDALQFGFVVDADCPVDPWRLADAYEREQRELFDLLPSLD
jgi:WS/DGAT C-terminal domain